MEKVMRQYDADVLIVGAGPTGLMMAALLALYKIGFRIIDKNKEPTVFSGALFIQALNLELFGKLGLDGKILKESIICKAINLAVDGKNLLRFPTDDFPEVLTPYPYMLMLAQSRTEAFLTGYLKAHGYTIERGVTFNEVVQDEESAQAVITDDRGELKRIRVQYIIGADGMRSMVRNRLNIPFRGRTHSIPFFIFDGKATVPCSNDEICFAISKDAMAGFFPLPKGRWRIDGNVKKIPPESRITFMHVASAIGSYLRMRTKLTQADWFSVFHSHRRMATLFRKKRCFLIGDAAHVQSPLGAQGMNHGFQDANNLAWKLAWVLKNRGKDDLLDTYAKERMTVVKRSAVTADLAFVLLASRNFLLKNIRDLLLPLLIRMASGTIKLPPVKHYIFKKLSQLDVRYRKSPLSHNEGYGKLKAGDRFPILETTGKATARFILYLPEKAKSEWNGTNKPLMEMRAYPPNLPKSISSFIYLVRPDGYIACRWKTIDEVRLMHFFRKFTLNRN